MKKTGGRKSRDTLPLIPPGDVEGHDEHPGEGGEEEELEQDGHGGAAPRGPYTRKIHSQ